MDQKRVCECLRYEALTGLFYWRISSRRVFAGMLAGAPTDRGYIQIQLDGRKHKAHRLAWLYVYGEWPALDLDHINGDTADNRIANLRLATKVQNQANSRRKRTIKGVRLHAGGKWEARIAANGMALYLGLFPTEEAAKAAYIARAVELFGEFAHP